MQSEISSVSIDGSILFTFSNGFQARACVKLAVALPLITVSAALINFGSCRVGDENRRGFLLISNPTNIKAIWAIKHVTDTMDTTKSIRSNAEILDDPTVFILSPLTGELQGPTVSADTAIHAPPRDFMRRYP